MGRKRIALALLVTLTLMGSWGCKQSTPEDPIVYETLSATFAQPIYTTINGSSAGAIPNTRIQLVGNGKDVTVSPGEKAALGQLEREKAIEVAITITGTNAYTAKFKYTMRGNMNFGPADLADTRIVNIERLIYQTPTTVNTRWNQSTINLSFNPDPDTGLRLPDIHINYILLGYNQIKDKSRGIIKTINVNRNGNVTYGTVPSDGEGYVFRTSDGNGVGTIEYVKDGAVVSFVFKCDPGSAGPGDAECEVFDTIFGGNVSACYITAFEFRFARGLQDAFYFDHEERAEYPGEVTSTSGTLSATTLEADDRDIIGLPSLNFGLINPKRDKRAEGKKR